jgi:uncharacterized membrane protein
MEKRSALPGLMLGMGLGGFVDGIFLHQVVQWHNMGSAVLPPTTMEAMRQNMLWDGWFHAATLLLVIVGVYRLLSDARSGLRMPTTKAFTGMLILGWGTFNLVEGVVDHHVLELHHVRDLPVHVPMLDWAFLVIGGAGFILLGRSLARDSEGIPSERSAGAAVP